MTTSMQVKQNTKKEPVIMEDESDKNIDENSKELVAVEEKNEVDNVMQTNKMMSWMMPIMSISIAFVAPLGLALYWLISNILMILERLILNKAIKSEEE